MPPEDAEMTQGSAAGPTDRSATPPGAWSWGGWPRLVRAALIALVMLFIFFLALHPLNSYDVWTHLAIGRLMWEEARIPDHEPFSYTMNREMTVDEPAPRKKEKTASTKLNEVVPIELDTAAPLKVVRYPVYLKDEQELPDAPPFSLVVPGGVPFDDETKKRLTENGIPLEDVTVKIEKPLRRLTQPACDKDGNVILPEGTILGPEEIEKLREAGVKTVQVTVPWVNHEWLFQVGAYLAYKWFGLNGPIFYKILILMIGYLFVLLAVYRRQTHVVGLAALFLAGIVSYKRFYMRPEVFSIMFTAVWLFLLERFRHNQKGWSIVIWLPLLMVVWINAHGYFILGVFVPIVYLLGEGLQQALPMPRFMRRGLLWKRNLITGTGYRKLALAAALTCAATLVNPYFIDGARYPFDVLQEVADPTSVIRTVIGEMQPPFHFSFTYAVFYTWALLYVSAASWLLNLRRLKLSRLILYVVSIIFLSKALRNMPFFGVPGAVYLAINVNEAWPDTIRFLRRYVLSQALTAVKVLGQLGLAAFSVFFMIWMASDHFYIRDIASMRFGLGYTRRKFSMGAIEWVRDHNVKGNLFNAFGMGGLCMWKLYPEQHDGKLHYGGRRLFIDGRAEVYGGSFVKYYTRSLDVINKPELFKALDDRFNFQVIFLNWAASDTHSMLRKFLQDKTDWELVYGDGVGYVYVRNNEQNKEIIREARRHLTHPQFVDFSRTYRRLARTLPGLPPVKGFRRFQRKIRDVAMCLNADPTIGAAVLKRTKWSQVEFERGFFRNGYDRFRDRFPILPKRCILTGEITGQSGFAAATNQIDLAEAILQGLKGISPEVPDINTQIGRIYEQRAGMHFAARQFEEGLGSLQQAVPYYERALEQYRNYPGLNIQMAMLAREIFSRLPQKRSVDRKKWSRKLEDYVYVARTTTYPTVSSATAMASLYGTLRKSQGAIDMYETVLHKLPQRDATFLHNRLGHYYLELAKQEPSRSVHCLTRAESHLKLAIDLDPDTVIPNSWLLLSQVYERSGRVGLAEKALKHVVTARTPNFDGEYNLAVFYLNRRRFKEGEDLFRKIIDRDSRHHNALFGLAQCLIPQKKRAEAIRCLERVIRLKPKAQQAKSILQKLKRGDPARRPTPPIR